MLHPRQTLQHGSHSAGAPVLDRPRILVVEDEYLQAENLREELEELGVEVVGPVPRVSAALALLAAGTPVDAAILDVSLGGERVFPVVEALQARAIPFVFATGYDAGTLPRAYAQVPCCVSSDIRNWPGGDMRNWPTFSLVRLRVRGLQRAFAAARCGAFREAGSCRPGW